MSETVAIDSNGDSDKKLVNPITDQSTISLRAVINKNECAGT